MKRKLKICCNCRLPKVIWKSKGSEKFCRTCWLKTGELTTGKVKQMKKSIRPSPNKIKQRSEKRAKQETLYKERRLRFLSEHPKCQVGVTGCRIKSEQIHHAKGRIGNLLCDTTHFLAVCDPCHKWIELHPEAAKQLGFSKSRLAK